MKSGPEVGSKVANFKVFATTGVHEGKEVDFPAERKDLPTVYFFVNHEHWGRPMARFIKTVDTEVGKGKSKTEAVAVWLTDKPDELKDHLPKVQQSLQMQATALAVFTGEKSGPKEWKVNDKAHITVVVVHKGQVKATIAHEAVTDADAKKVVDAVKKPSNLSSGVPS